MYVYLKDLRWSKSQFIQNPAGQITAFFSVRIILEAYVIPIFFQFSTSIKACRQRPSRLVPAHVQTKYLSSIVDCAQPALIKFMFAPPATLRSRITPFALQSRFLPAGHFCLHKTSCRLIEISCDSINSCLRVNMRRIVDTSLFVV